MPRKINIAIAGFGNIGSYFYQILEKNKKNISIKTGKTPFVKYITAKNINKKRNFKIPKTKWFKNSLNLVSENDVDIIVELIGGAEGIAKKLVFSALKNQKRDLFLKQKGERSEAEADLFYLGAADRMTGEQRRAYPVTCSHLDKCLRHGRIWWLLLRLFLFVLACRQE